MVILFLIISVLAFVFFLVAYLKSKWKKEQVKRELFIEERKKYTKTEYLKDFKDIGFSESISESLIKNIRTVMDDDDENLPIMYPKPEDKLLKIWGIDEEKADILERMFNDFGEKKKLKWNSKAILSLQSTKDLLQYFQDNLKNTKEKKPPQENLNMVGANLHRTTSASSNCQSPTKTC
jgi:hypothetical protein